MKEQQYQGPERRKEDRRKGRERREEMRWEPDKNDRRQGPGRRFCDKHESLWRS